MTTPQDARFAASHEYVMLQDGMVKVGISRYAAEQLGDVVFVELPALGAQLKKGQSFGVVESVKAVSDLYAPVDGEVIAVNQELEEEPGLVGEDPYGRGWMLKLKPTDGSQLASSELMTPDAYSVFAGSH